MQLAWRRGIWKMGPCVPEQIVAWGNTAGTLPLPSLGTLRTGCFPKVPGCTRRARTPAKLQLITNQVRTRLSQTLDGTLRPGCSQQALELPEAGGAAKARLQLCLPTRGSGSDCEGTEASWPWQLGVWWAGKACMRDPAARALVGLHAGWLCTGCRGAIARPCLCPPTGCSHFLWVFSSSMARS